MAERMISYLSVICLSMTTAIGSDQPITNTPPVPSRVKREPSEQILQHGDELRQTADDPEVQRTCKLNELRQQAAEIDRQIREIEGLSQDPAQLEVEFKAVEIDVAELDRLGFQWETIVPSKDETIVQTADALGTPDMLETIPPETMKGLLEGLVSNGSAKVLSAVTMKLSSGRPATLFSGGEFPILVPQSEETVSIEWRECGTRIEVLADVLQDGRIQLHVAPEYSWKDFSKAVRLHGMVIPEVTTVRLNTQVEMEFGRTLLLGGETSTEQTLAIQKAEPGQEVKGDVTDVPTARKRIVVFATPRRLEAPTD